MVRYLVDQGQIDPKRLMAVGCAEFAPLFSNDSREHRALNRRADIVILYPPDDRPLTESLGLGGIKPLEITSASQ